MQPPADRRCGIPIVNSNRIIRGLEIGKSFALARVGHRIEWVPFARPQLTRRQTAEPFGDIDRPAEFAELPVADGIHPDSDLLANDLCDRVFEARLIGDVIDCVLGERCTNHAPETRWADQTSHMGYQDPVAASLHRRDLFGFADLSGTKAWRYGGKQGS